MVVQFSDEEINMTKEKNPKRVWKRKHKKQGFILSIKRDGYIIKKYLKAALVGKS